MNDPELNLRGKLAHTDQMLTDHDRERQESRLVSCAAWQLAVIGMAAGAALFAAGMAFAKWIGG